MSLKGCPGLLARHAFENRVASLRARRRQLIASRPAIAARAWAAARAYDEGQPIAAAQALVEAACGLDPGVVDLVDCRCAGCTTKVPSSMPSGLCGWCLFFNRSGRCTHGEG